MPSASSELLFEIGVEELPAGFIDPALTFLADKLAAELDALRLPHSAVVAEGTPRRLALMVNEVAARQADLTREVTGPSWSVAFDDAGQPTPAGQGFMKKNGLARDDVRRVETSKGAVAQATVREIGKSAREVLPAVLAALLDAIPFKKRMFWGDARVTHAKSFARPVQWILALHAGAVLPVQWGDVVAGSVTRGHRYHAPGTVSVASIAEYRAALARGQVMLSRAERRQRIVDEANKLARTAGGSLREDNALLEIVKNLVEKPFPVLGTFEESYLEMPAELLVSEMREHQKYFAVQSASGALLPYFVVVAGSDSSDKQALAAGNARVLRSRFADGAFYFKTDRERPLASRIEDLKKVVFHRELGTLWEKTARVAMVTQKLCELLGVAPEKAQRTAMLSKADLTTGVVNEFPELQGIMGRTYALYDGENVDVARGIDEHYAPRHAGAALPSTLEGALVGVADRVDTIVGILGIGKAPTANADPFALKRAAIGLTHVFMERGWRAPVRDVVVAGVAAYKAQGKLAKVDDVALVKQVVDFLRGRVRNVLVERCEGRGLDGASDIVDAAMAARAGVEVLPDVEENAIALAELRARDAAAFLSLCKTFKRVGNILKQARNDGAVAPADDEGAPFMDTARLVEPAETSLSSAVSAMLSRARGEEGTAHLTLDAKRDMLAKAAQLKPAVDKFFDDVMVMAEDRDLRTARLGLLARIERVFVDVADFTKVQVDAQ
ncbi:MAG TPA: glycine--tRNA ligase subunit beta [Myxococcota bacterium]